MNRRDATLALLAASAEVWPLRSQAQANARVYRVAVLEFGSLAPGSWLRTQTVNDLKALGYIEGQNLVLDLRPLAGIDAEGQDAIVTEVTNLKPDVIIVPGTGTAHRAAKATRSIPIVMVASVDPVGAGLAQSLARPGGNVTGSALDVGTGAEEKRMEILLEMLPKARRIAFVGTQIDWDAPWGKAVRGVAAKRGVSLVLAEGKTNGVTEALDVVKKEKAEAFFVALSPWSGKFSRAFADFTVANHIPSSCGLIEMVDLGCLMGYGQSGAAMWIRVMAYVDKILKGAKPADLPIEQPTTFPLVINLRTAKAIGMKIPQSILVRADSVVE